MFKYLQFTPLDKQNLLFTFVVNNAEFYPTTNNRVFFGDVYFRTKAI